MFHRNVFAIVVMVLACHAVQGDVVRLKGGGEIRGRKLSADDAAQVVVQTLAGVTVTVAREDVAFVVPRPLIHEEYESYVRKVGDTLEEQIRAAEWCRQRGLTDFREVHLRRVLEIDPNHEQSHLALGHTWHEGEWVDRDELMASRGYIKYKGRYITQQELDLIEKTEEELQEERTWSPKIRQWVTWVKGADFERQQRAMEELRRISDPNAAPGVAKFMIEDANYAVRQLGIQSLGRMEGLKPVKGLVKAMLYDSTVANRQLAVEKLKPDQYQTAQAYLLRELRNGENLVVCRAGIALEQIGDELAISPLIDALQTTHRYRVRVQDPNQALSFGNGVAIPPEILARLQTGQYPNGIPGLAPKTRLVTINYTHQNVEILTALQRLTDENFGFDQRTWRLWWAAKKAGFAKP